jgi:protein tyrosine phosphatase
MEGQHTSRIRKRTLWTLLLVCTTAGAAVGFLYHQHKRYKHLHVHEKGMVYRSAWLEPDAMQEVIEKYQIRTVVNLCAPGEMGVERWGAERAAVTNSGARLIELQMTLSTDASDPLISRHLAVLNNPDNYPLLVHCQHGVTRTAKFLAIYDIVYRRQTGEQSLAAQPLFGRDQHNVNIRAFVKDFEKKRRELYPTARADRLSTLRQ